MSRTGSNLDDINSVMAKASHHILLRVVGGIDDTDLQLGVCSFKYVLSDASHQG